MRRCIGVVRRCIGIVITRRLCYDLAAYMRSTPPRLLEQKYGFGEVITRLVARSELVFSELEFCLEEYHLVLAEDGSKLLSRHK